MARYTKSRRTNTRNILAIASSALLVLSLLAPLSVASASDESTATPAPVELVDQKLAEGETSPVEELEIEPVDEALAEPVGPVITDPDVLGEASTEQAGDNEVIEPDARPATVEPCRILQANGAGAWRTLLNASVSGGVATFTIPEDSCPLELTFSVYTWPDDVIPNLSTGFPYDVQIHLDSVTGVYGPGTHTLRVPIPDCGYYQTDLYLGPPIYELASYGHPHDKIIAWSLGGEQCPETADITVVKFNDLNENGVLDDGEPYVEGVEITIEGAEYTDSANTDASGTVVFSDLYAGSYTIDEVVPDGWFATVELPIVVDLVEGQDQMVYIGNAEVVPDPIPADITVVKFNDLNENGVLDDGEPYVEGVEITIEGTEYTDSANTDASGTVVFSDLYAGSYTIDEVVPDGWFATVELPIVVDLVEGQDQMVYIGNAEEELPFTYLDLAIEKKADVETATTGDIITYTLTYRNLGSVEASDFTITDDFDETLVEIVDSAGGVVADGTIVWSLTGPLALEDGDQTITYTARVLGPIPAQGAQIDNVVVINHPRDENPENDTGSETVAAEPYLPFTPQPQPQPEPEVTSVPTAAPTATDPEPFLPFTGGESLLMALLAGVAVLTGLALRRVGADN